MFKMCPLYYIITLFCFIGVNTSSEGVEETKDYAVGDILDISCQKRNVSNDAAMYYGLIYKLENNTIYTVIKNDTDLDLIYTLTAYKVDNKAEISCVGKSFNYITNMTSDLQSNNIKLRISDYANYTLPEIRYGENLSSLFPCNVNISEKEVYNNNFRASKTPKVMSIRPNSSFALGCHVIQEQDNHYIREIYNMTKYEPMGRKSLPITLVTGICFSLVGCMTLVVIFVYLRSKKKKNKSTDVRPLPNQDVELQAASNQLIYAELDLSQRTSNARISAAENNTTYAQITGFLAQKPTTRASYNVKHRLPQ